MERRFRLTRSTDIKRVRRLGKSYAHPLIVLVATPNEQPTIRIGVSAGRSVGGAVERNRGKRLLRATLHSLLPDINTGWDLVFLARQGLSEATYEQTCLAVKELLKRARLFKSKPYAS
ncbi:MAG TPA: ribonuclease P protein component [Anaerolineaceae bacterium]